MAGLRYVPFLLYVAFLGVICTYRSSVITAVYLRTTYCKYCHAWGSIALLILIVLVYHRVQTTAYARVLTYRQLFFV